MKSGESYLEIFLVVVYEMVFVFHLPIVSLSLLRKVLKQIF